MSKEANPCSNCDSTSMEVCLLVRHCKHWCVVKETDNEDDSDDE